MNPPLRTACLIACSALLLAGCWDNNELTGWGFVQAVALDQDDTGKIRMTAQVYRPGSSEASSQSARKGESFITLSASDTTFSKASLRIAGKLGRQLQWGHMQAVLIGEKLAQNRSITQMVDFFTRSHGPRGSVNVMLTEGEARQYLTVNPLIENTIGEQLRTTEKIASTVVGISPPTTLLDLTIMSLEPGVRAIVPHFRLVSEQHKVINMDGVAVLRFPQGTTDAEIVPPGYAAWYMMILGKYKYGQLTLPCRALGAKPVNGGGADESFWINSAKVKSDVASRNGKPYISLRFNISGSLGEITCSDVSTKEGTELFLRKLEETMTAMAGDAVAYAQQRRADVILAGQHVRRHHPRLWRDWQQTWDDWFARAEVAVTVKAALTDSGMSAGKPVSSLE